MNKEVESYNLQLDTFTARRITCDHVNAVGGIFNVDVANKQLQVAAKNKDAELKSVSDQLEAASQRLKDC